MARPRPRSARVVGALGFMLAVAIAGEAAAPSPARATSSRVDTSWAAARAGAFLADRQGDDGSVPSGWRPDQVAEGWAALRAVGVEDRAVARARDFVVDHAVEGSSSGPYTGRIVAGLIAGGVEPRHVDGVDLVARLRGFHDPVSGSYGGQNLYADGLAMLGLLAAGEPLTESSVRRLQINQCRDGGWSHREGCLSPADTDTTALITAVLAVGAPDAAEVAEGRAWLLAARRADGGWGADPEQPVNTNSTALAIQTVITLGEDPEAAPWATSTGSPMRALLDLQRADGAFGFLAGGRADDYATVQALPALARWSLPLRADQPATSSKAPSAGDSAGNGTAVVAAGAQARRDQAPQTDVAAPGSEPDADPASQHQEPTTSAPDPGAGSTQAASAELSPGDGRSRTPALLVAVVALSAVATGLARQRRVQHPATLEEPLP